MSSTTAQSLSVAETKPRVFDHIGDLLAYYGRTNPDHDALLTPDRAALNYAALWSQSNEIVRALRAYGIRQQDRVAVVLPGGVDSAVAILGVAAGAVCVPLHPGFAANEWRRYFDELRIAALLTSTTTDSSCRSVAYSLGITVIDLLWHSDKAPAGWRLSRGAAGLPAADAVATAEDDAFILLTSGTTSRPKLVPLTQAGVCRSAWQVGTSLGLTHEDRLLSVLPFFHAHGLFSGLLAAVAAGSSLVALPSFETGAFFRALTRFRPTWYTAVPPIHRALIAAAPRYKRAVRRSSLRVIRSASVTLPVEVRGELEALFGVPVIDTYGMTEAASQIAANPPPGSKPGSVGKPSGVEVAVTDDAGQALPAGEPGEVTLRGPTIARTYLNNDTATRAAFRDGWFRTGDLGYLDPDGYLFLTGRIKKADVINRGGQKISPAEVEAVLLSHPAVAKAAAFPLPHPRLGQDVAAAVVLRPDANINATTLRRFAMEHLARFKIPGLIRMVPQIPTGPDGEISRGELGKQLAITQNRARAERDGIMAPRSEQEWHLARHWAELLEAGEIGIDQDVFALGADSLTVTQMLSRLRAQFGIDLTFRDILDAPTIADLALRLESAERGEPAAAPGLDPATAASSGPLSLQQQRIDILSKLERIGHEYHVLNAVQISGAFDPDILQDSITEICGRHEQLRSIFFERQGEPVQTVTTMLPVVERIDLGPLSQRARAEAMRSQARRLIEQPFDLTRQTPIKIRLLKLDQEDHVLMIMLHHLITDGWSQRLFWQELGTLYAAKARGSADALAPLPMQYRHFIDWQRNWLDTPAAQAQLSYWRARLDGLTELPLRTDRPRPHTSTGRGARLAFKLPRRLTRALQSLSRTHNATLFMTLLAALQCLLQRYTHHDDVAVGSLIANRKLAQTERLIGMFANAIVLRTDLSGDPSFSEVMARVRQVTLEAHHNQELPIERILQHLNLPRRLDRNQLFRVMFILQKAPLRELAGLSARFLDLDPGIARSDLLLELTESDGCLQGWIEYSVELFEADTIKRMAAQFRRLLESIVGNPKERLSRLTLLPERERDQLLLRWNPSHRRAAGRAGGFLAGFSKQVARKPAATAVSIGPLQLSYRALADRAAAIAARLEGDFDRGGIVVLFAERGVDLLAAMIAVQQAGLAFLPLDPAIRPPGLLQMIRHSGAKIALASKATLPALRAAIAELSRPMRPRTIELDRIGKTRGRDRKSSPRRTAASLACVIYTSGSTGAPKGAMIEARGLVNHLWSKIDDLGLTGMDTVAQTSPASFVIAIWQFLAPLMVGARVHICADEAMRDPRLLMQEISREKITILQMVPALLREILRPAPSEPTRRALSGLRALISTGEALPPDLARDWFRHVPAVPLINAYGATECSDDVATHRLQAPPDSAATVPIGRPVANAQLYVLDPHLQPVPIGVAGELFVGGVAVGRGYLNDVEQTRRRFIRDPFSSHRNARLYRTGDLARWRADATLECLGRLDHQVKIRGCRIELEEVEHILMEYPGVRSAIVVARDNRLDDLELIGCLVAAQRQPPTATELRDFLNTRLPAHMIPAGYCLLDHLPLTAHGKLDRLALKRLAATAAMPDDALVQPRNDTERRLIEIWGDLLDTSKVGIHSNFFDLGGHSLLAGRVLARVAELFGVALPIRVLFEASTIEALAERIDEARQRSAEPSSQAVMTRAGEGSPVSMAQAHMFKIEQALPGLPQFNLPYAFRMMGALNIAALEQSLREIVRRHESLRTGFTSANRNPVAVIVPADQIEPMLTVENLAIGRAVDRRVQKLLIKKACLIAEQEAWTAFDIARAPLLRARVLRLGPKDHVLVLVLHHMVCDGWSVGLIFEQIAAAYAAITSGQEPGLAEPVAQFSEFARLQRAWCESDTASQHAEYWKNQLSGAPSIFPAEIDRPAAALGSPIAHEPIHLSKQLVARLTSLSRGCNATLFMTLLAGFKALLLARRGCTDICVATAMANRTMPWTERVLGPVENTTLIRTRIDPDLSFLETLSRVRNAVLEAYTRQQLPFEIVATRLANETGQDITSLLQALFVMQNAIQRPLGLPGLTIRSFGNVDREGQPVLPIDRTRLALMLKERASGIGGSASYKQDLFEGDEVRDWIVDYETILVQAAENPGLAVGRLIDRGDVAWQAGVRAHGPAIESRSR